MTPVNSVAASPFFSSAPAEQRGQVKQAMPAVVPSPDSGSSASDSVQLIQPPRFDAFKQARQTSEQPQSLNTKAQKASRMVSAFKILGAGLGAGIAMSMLFGSPPAFAIGLSFAGGIAQHFIAERIFKGNNAVSQKITDLCGKLVSNKPAKNEKGLSYEDKCVASVWGAVTALFTVGEAVINLMLARKPKTADEIRARLQKCIASSNHLKFLYQLQLNGFNWKEKTVKRLSELFFVKNLSARTAGATGNGLLRLLKKYKKPLTLLAILPVSWLSGYVQGIAAAKLAKHATQPGKQQKAA